jgi:hypothetical protein
MSELKAMQDKVEDIWASSLGHIHVDIIQRYMDEQATKIAEQQSINEAIVLLNAELREQLAEANERIKLADNLISDILEHDCMESHSIINYAINTVIPTSGVKG